MTPAIEAITLAHQAVISGSFSAAVCSLISRNSRWLEERRAEQLELTARAGKQFERLLAKALPCTPQHSELTVLRTMLDDLRRSIERA